MNQIIRQQTLQQNFRQQSIQLEQQLAQLSRNKDQLMTMIYEKHHIVNHYLSALYTDTSKQYDQLNRIINHYLNMVEECYLYNKKQLSKQYDDMVEEYYHCKNK